MDPYVAPRAEARPVVQATGSPRSVSDPSEVARIVQKDLMANPAGYLGAGTAYIVATFALVGASIALLFLCMLPGILAEDDTLLAIGGVVGFGVYTVAILGFSFVAFPVMSASLMREMEAHRGGGPAIGFRSLFTHMGEDWVRIAGFYLLVNVLAMVGMFALYLPGLVVMVVGAIAFPMVVLERQPGWEALGRAWAHLKANLGWHVGVWLLLILVVVVAELTIVGLFVVFPVTVAWQLAAYRLAFGETAEA